MLTYFCPKCWMKVNQAEKVCPGCGYDLSSFHDIPFEEKLIRSLNHTVPERRIVAAQVLGNMHSVKALAEFNKIVESEDVNYYFLRAVLLATAKIDHPDRIVILKKATQKPSSLIAKLANDLLLMIAENKDINEWDKNTS